MSLRVIWQYMDRSIYCHMTLSTMNYLLYNPWWNSHSQIKDNNENLWVHLLFIYLLQILRIPANNRSSALNMTSLDRTLNDSEQDVHTSTLNDSGDVHTSTLNSSEQDVHTSTLNNSGDVHTSTCSTETMV